MASDLTVGYAVGWRGTFIDSAGVVVQVELNVARILAFPRLVGLITDKYELRAVGKVRHHAIVQHRHIVEEGTVQEWSESAPSEKQETVVSLRCSTTSAATFTESP